MKCNPFDNGLFGYDIKVVHCVVKGNEHTMETGTLYTQNIFVLIADRRKEKKYLQILLQWIYKWLTGISYEKPGCFLVWSIEVYYMSYPHVEFYLFRYEKRAFLTEVVGFF